jgi:hypothetical protein
MSPGKSHLILLLAKRILYIVAQSYEQYPSPIPDLTDVPTVASMIRNGDSPFVYRTVEVDDSSIGLDEKSSEIFVFSPSLGNKQTTEEKGRNIAGTIHAAWQIVKEEGVTKEPHH